MRSYFSLVIATIAINTDLFAAEAGMPQLDPKYWASQAFWLILIFTILYISIAKFYLPKIKNNLDDRENKIKDDVDDANKFKELSESKFKEYEIILADAKKEVIKIQLSGLQQNDLEYKDSGIEQTWKFAHPNNKRVTGPLSNFKMMIKSDSYGMMINHLSHNY